MKLSEYEEKTKDNREYQEALKALEYQFLFGNAILRARLARGWTQKELAKRVGTKQANISRIESGSGNPTLELIQKICKALELEIRFLDLGKAKIEARFVTTAGSSAEDSLA